MANKQTDVCALPKLRPNKASRESIGIMHRTAGGLRVLSLIQARNLIPFRWLILPAAGNSGRWALKYKGINNMASFQRNPDEWERLDWRILLNGAISLYFHEDVLSKDIEWFKQNGYQVYKFDCATWLSEENFHSDFQNILPLPGYYGRNLNALNDSLIDIRVPEFGGCVLQFMRFDLFAKRLPNIAQATLDIIERTSRRFLLTGQRFMAVVQSDNPRISFDPVGACPVMWNSKEWLDSKRGL